MTPSHVLNSLRGIGLAQREEEMPLITDEPKIKGYLVFPGEETKKKYPQAEEAFGQGFDPDDRAALIKAHAEFLERLCSYHADPSKLSHGKYDRSGAFVDPGRFLSLSEEQLPDRELERERMRTAPYHWQRVKEVATGKEVFLPAQLIYLAQEFNNEFPIRGERISTGSAFGRRGTGRAFRSGFYEAVERDACISAYLLRRPVRRIIEPPGDVAALEEYLHRYNLETHLFDTTTDLEIPTVMAITLDRSGIGAAVNVGSRASGTYAEAMTGALLESIHCRRTSRVMKQLQFPEKLPGEEEITSMDKRFYYWYPVERIKELSHVLENEGTVSYRELQKRDIGFPRAVKNVLAKGFHIYLADFTLPEVAAKGFEALKTVIPELHPLYLDERAKALYSIHHGAIPDDKTLKPHPLT